jgi:hypothetical protein
LFVLALGFCGAFGFVSVLMIDAVYVTALCRDRLLEEKTETKTSQNRCSSSVHLWHRLYLLVGMFTSWSRNTLH